MAAILSNTEKTYYGLARCMLEARCIVYHTKNGDSYAKSFYGCNQTKIQELKSWLKTKNIIIDNNFHDKEIDGCVPSSLGRRSTLYGGPKKIKIVLTNKVTNKKRNAIKIKV